MTDQELLEYAAKAVGLTNPRYVENTSWGTGISHGEGDRVYVVWNPLLSDADAFRLMTKIEVWPSIGNDGEEDEYVFAHRGMMYYNVAYYDGEPLKVRITNPEDKAAFVRRAIVLAAAEIGRNMSE